VSFNVQTPAQQYRITWHKHILHPSIGTTLSSLLQRIHFSFLVLLDPSVCKTFRTHMVLIHLSPTAKIQGIGLSLAGFDFQSLWRCFVSWVHERYQFSSFHVESSLSL
jgi:hypothetical protein